MTKSRGNLFVEQWADGKLERFHDTLKSEYTYPNWPEAIEEANRRVIHFMLHYNDRL